MQRELHFPPEDLVEIDWAGIPQVSFDTRLGKQVGEIDFDTEAYADYLRGRGLTEDQIGHTAVDFEHRPILGTIGPKSLYDSQDGIKVHVTPFMSGKKASKAVYHESEHHIANLTNTRSPVALTAASNLSYLGGMAGSVVGAGLMGAGNVLAHPEVFNTGKGTVIGALAVLALGRAIYASNPEERRAHKAAHDKPPLVKIT